MCVVIHATKSCVFVTKYLFRREICSAGTYFTENLLCRNFFNEKLVPGTYFRGKCIRLCEICSGIYFTTNSEICFEMNITNKLLVRQSWFFFLSNIWLISRQRCKIPNVNKNKYEFIYNKGNNKITELRTILQRESQNS